MADRKITDQNVFFLSGFQNTLNQKVAAGEIQVGAFYLTEDTNRLYIGKEAGKLDLLNYNSDIVYLVEAEREIYERLSTKKWKTVDNLFFRAKYGIKLFPKQKLKKHIIL